MHVKYFADFIEKCIEVFMDDFTVYGNDFDSCLNSLVLILKRHIDTKLILDFEKCRFMAFHCIVLGHLVSFKVIEVDKSKIDVIQNLPYPTCLKDVLSHFSVVMDFIKDSLKTSLR